MAEMALIKYKIELQEKLLFNDDLTKRIEEVSAEANVAFNDLSLSLHQE
jgi:hypothetical protein